MEWNMSKSSHTRTRRFPALTAIATAPGWRARPPVALLSCRRPLALTRPRRVPEPSVDTLYPTAPCKEFGTLDLVFLELLHLFNKAR